MKNSLLLAGLVYSLSSFSSLYDHPLTIQNIVNTTDAHIRLEVYEPGKGGHLGLPTALCTFKPQQARSWQKLLHIKNTKITLWLLEKDTDIGYPILSYKPSGNIKELDLIIRQDIHNSITIDLINVITHQKVETEFITAL